MNLLAIALRTQGRQTVLYRRWMGRAPNAAGLLVDTFAAGVRLQGSFQPLSRERVAFQGLDTSKSWATFFAPGGYRPVERGAGADKFNYAGREYTAQGKADWLAQDGWNAVLLVDTGSAAPVPPAGVPQLDWSDGFPQNSVWLGVV